MNQHSDIKYGVNFCQIVIIQKYRIYILDPCDSTDTTVTVSSNHSTYYDAINL